MSVGKLLPLRPSTLFTAVFLVVFNLAITAVLAAEKKFLPAHKCIPKSASSTLKCEKPGPWGKYCRSTRQDSVFWASNDSPIATAANSVLLNRDYQAVRDVHVMLEDVASKARDNLDMLTSKRNCNNFFTENREWRRGTSEASYITNEQFKWTRAQYTDARIHSLKIPRSHCYSQVSEPVDSPASLNMFRTLSSFSQVLNKTSKVLHERAKEGTSFFDQLVRCWATLNSHMDGLTHTKLFQCRVIVVAGVRRDNGTYTIPVAYTNEQHHKGFPEKMRLYVVEAWSVGKDDHIRTHRLPSFRRGDDSSVVNETTTFFSTWGGRLQISHFFNIPTNDGPAVRLVKQAAKKMVDNVNDSMAKSNVAILLLLAFPSLIPISCIEYVSKKTLIANIILMDFIPVLPLAIKGVELINDGRKSPTGCVSYTVGTENPKSELATIETWCAQCKVHEQAMSYGMGLLAAAVAFMVLGITLELTTYRSLRKRIRALEEQKEPLWWQRPALRQYVRRRRPTCTECECCEISMSFTSSRYDELWEESSRATEWWK